MWITKDDCKEGNHAQSHGVAAFEYLYSHVQYTTGPHTHIDDRQNSNINMYIGCEKPGGYDVGSTVEGTVLRFNIIDDNSNWVLFDYPMTASGSFDTITHDWVSIILTVTRHQVHVFVDGAVVEDSTFGFPTDAMGQCQDTHITPSCQSIIDGGHECSEQMSTAAAPADGSPADPHFIGHTLEDFCEASCGGCTDTDNPRIGMMNNIAYPHPSALRSPLTDFDLRSPIYIGARYDLDATKHFQVRANHPLL